MGLLAGPPTADAAPPRDCLRSGTTLDANGDARLFRVGPSGDNLLYVCWLANRRVHKLGALDLGETGPDHPVLAGRWVAYDRIACADGQTCAGRVVVRDAKTGRERYRAPAQPGVTTRIVLTPNGTAAWIRDHVYKLDAQGVTVLDGASPPGLDHRSLALAGARAYWLRDGQAQSAVLDAADPEAPHT